MSEDEGRERERATPKLRGKGQGADIDALRILTKAQLDRHVVTA